MEGFVLLQTGPVPEDVGVGGREAGEDRPAVMRVVETDEPGAAVEVACDLPAAANQIHLDELSGPEHLDEVLSVLLQTGQVRRAVRKPPDFRRLSAGPDDDGLTDQLLVADDLVVAVPRQQLDVLDVGADGQQVLAVLEAGASLALDPDVPRVEQDGA